MPEAKGDYFAMDWKAWTFENFLKNVIERTPGYLSSLYELYIDNPPINFVGKTEYLTDDLVKALQTAGETFDEYKLRSTPMMNTSIMRAEYPKDLELKIRELEKRAFERFGYE